MANEEHLNLLNQGVEVWNEWRKQNRQIRPDLHEAYLVMADLGNADLGNADLGNADLSNADLGNADLSNADLSNADLSNADLSNADLSNADFSEANLSGADLSEMKKILIEVNLKGANSMAPCSYYYKWRGRECGLNTLPGENYCYWHKEQDGKHPTEDQFKELKEKEIQEIYLKNTMLWYEDLQGVNLIGAHLEGTDLSGAILTGADLQEAKLQGAILYYADLQEADLTGANLEGAILSVAKLQGANLTEANLQKAKINSADLQGVILTGADLQEADLTGANLEGAFLLGANLQGANLTGANLQKSDLQNTRFDSRTVFDYVNMTGANLYQSYFDETKSFRNLQFLDKGDREINETVADMLNIGLIELLNRFPFLNKFIKYSIKLISKLLFFNLDNLFVFPFNLSLRSKRKCYVIEIDCLIHTINNFGLNSLITDDYRMSEIKKLNLMGFVSYVSKYNMSVVFFNPSLGCFVKNPGNRGKKNCVRVDGIADLVLEKSIIRSKLHLRDMRKSFIMLRMKFTTTFTTSTLQTVDLTWPHSSTSGGKKSTANLDGRRGKGLGRYLTYVF